MTTTAEIMYMNEMIDVNEYHERIAFIEKKMMERGMYISVKEV